MIGLIELVIGCKGLVELRIGLIELRIGLIELGIGPRIDNARRTVLARVSGLVFSNFRVFCGSGRLRARKTLKRIICLVSLLDI